MKIEKPVAACCMAIIILSSAIVVALNVAGNNIKNNLSAFSVTIKHYGVNAKEIERTIAMPLEDALYSIDNVKSILTVSENGKAAAYIMFKSGSNLFFNNKKLTEGRYESVSDAAQKVYESLPSSVQKPEITTSTENRRAVWSAALYCDKDASYLNNLVERRIKPALKSVEGAAEVEVSGTGINEIIIALNTEQNVIAGLTHNILASYLSSTDLLLPAGSVKEGEREIVVMADGHYKDITQLKQAIIPVEEGKTVRLQDLATISEHIREPDTFSRLNGKQASLISVYPNYDAPLGKLSRSIKNKVTELEKYPVKIEVLSDTGAEESDAFRSVMLAALQGAFAVALISALLIRGAGNRRLTTIICALVVPYICILSASLLIIFGVDFNKILLAGLASGLGAAVDTTIICTEYLNVCKSIEEIKLKLKEVKIPLISGSLTTIIALMPIMFTSFATKEILTIAYTIVVVNFVSLMLALTILPPFFSLNVKSLYFRKKVSTKILATDHRTQNVLCVKSIFVLPMDCNVILKNRIWRSILKLAARIKRWGTRSIAYVLNICIDYPKIICFSALLITALGIFTIIINGTDTGANESENTIYAQIEFTGGIRAEVVDRSLEAWAKNIKEKEGIINVQCNSHVDSSSILVSFEPQIILKDDVKKILKSEKIQGGFLYIPENSNKDRIWSITVSGESTEKCKEIASALAEKCSAIPIVQETVLNFKEGSKNITFMPQRERIAQINTSSNKKPLFTDFATLLRWNIHGPVAYKRLGDSTQSSDLSNSSGETDVRIRGNLLIPDKKQIMELAINLASNDGQSSSIANIDTLLTTSESREESSIRRLGRRRIAAISIRTHVADVRSIKNIVMPLLISEVKLPQGYSFEFDPDAIEAAESLGKTVFYFVLALLFCYMIIAAVNESFIVPLIVLSVVPVSAAVPAICLQAAGFRFNASAACALLAVCGLAVNSSVLVVDNILRNAKKELTRMAFFKAVRCRFSVLAATTGTTILASLPFIFLGEKSNSMIRVLSIVSASGVFVSFICSLFLVPSVIVLFKGKKFCVAGHTTSKQR
ncbi:MAG: hypothetical protein Ta2B_05090 [Termitinemataceae bacterium]|nr:MAG: hypothetical protein Ta2B_05090 [Termitinemataceae bacterium]